MPRVHHGVIRRRHGAASAAPDMGRGGGGIFTLSTPFKDAVAASASASTSASASASASASSSGDANNMFLLASVAGDRADRGHVNDYDDADATNDAIVAAAAAAAKSDDGGPAGGERRWFGDGMEDGDDDDDDSDATSLGDDGIDRDEGRDTEEDGEEDGDGEDDDGDGSVDLLLADEGGAGAFGRRGGGGGGNGDNDGSRRRKRGRRRARGAPTAAPASASPATRTLDRLAALGSQAELCIHLLVDDAAAGDTSAAASTAAAATSPGGEVHDAEGNHDGKDEEDGHDADEVAKGAAMVDEAVRCSNTKRGGGTTAGAATTTTETASPIRKDDGDGDDDDMMEKRQRCLRSLKKYFMSTKNSSKYAMQQQRQQAKRNPGSGADIVLPTALAVPFCRRCNRPSSASSRSTSTGAAAMPSHVPPHHGLCPHHADFYSSGSYEILNLIVDGNLLKCEACVYQFDHGRLNKALCHIDGCERKKRMRNNEKNGGCGGSANNTSSDSGSNVGGDCADGKESYGKDNKKERGSSDGDEIRKKHFGGGIGTCNLPTMSSHAVAWTSTGAGVRSTRSANSQLSPPPGAAMHGQTKTKADAVSKSSVDQGCQSVVQEQGPMFEVGTVVFVQDRTWPGRNDLGGVARIAKVHQPNDEDEDDGDDRATYDVRYVLETRREKYVEERYLSLHTEYVSPSKNAQDSGVVQTENTDSGSQASSEANGDDTTAIDAVEAKSAGIGDDINRGTTSQDHVDADGRPLSEYERLRLRNIQRNKSRLAQLGLLVPTDKTDKDASSGIGGKKRKASHQPRGVEVERRFQPKRQASTNRREGDGKPKVSTSSSAASAAAAGDEIDQRGKVSLTYVGDSEGDDLDQRQSQLKMTMEVEDDHVKQNKQAQNFHVAINALGAKLLIATLADAAKAGCRKCTLEWQTEKTYSAMDHDVCCPRVGKRAPPSNNESLTNLSQLIPLCHIEQNKRAHNQPTPSSAPPQRKENITPQQRPPPHYHNTLPSWINEFILVSNRHNETVPAPRGSKWIPCPNPWGTIGHEDGDFVIISPFQSETAHDILSIFHRGPNGSGMPKRFVANPLEEGSPYHATHRSPARGGYSALRLLRDMTSLRPWGFTVRLHEFGGACLVESIEPLSPAEAAEDISGWTDESSSSGLKLHDMIICINGKSISSLTMAELLVEFDVCGPEMMLVVSRFDIQEMGASQELTTLEDLAMDWNDIGAGATLRRDRVSFEDDCNSGDLCESEDQSDAQGDEKEELQKYGAESEIGVTHVGNRHDSVMMGLQPSLARDETSDASRSLPAQTHHVTLSKALKIGPKASPSEAAESGCRKCSLELETGIKDSSPHCPICPRKTKPRSSKKDNIHKYAQPFETGKKHGHDSSYEGRNSRMECESNLTVHNQETGGNVNPNETIRTRMRLSKPVSRYQKQLGEQSDNESDMLPKRHPKLYTKESKYPALPAEGFPSNWKVREIPRASNCSHKDKYWYSPIMGYCFRSRKGVHRYLECLEEENGDEVKAIYRYRGSGSKKICQDMPYTTPSIDDAATETETPRKHKRINLPSKDWFDEDSSSSSIADDDCEGDDDENPWLGCVCGKTHPSPIRVFWVQCESCEAWYNVAEECVGFDGRTAEKMDKWCCWACDPPVDGLGL